MPCISSSTLSFSCFLSFSRLPDEMTSCFSFFVSCFCLRRVISFHLLCWTLASILYKNIREGCCIPSHWTAYSHRLPLPVPPWSSSLWWWNFFLYFLSFFRRRRRDLILFCSLFRRWWVLCFFISAEVQTSLILEKASLLSSPLLFSPRVLCFRSKTL